MASLQGNEAAGLVVPSIVNLSNGGAGASAAPLSSASTYNNNHHNNSSSSSGPNSNHLMHLTGSGLPADSVTVPSSEGTTFSSVKHNNILSAATPHSTVSGGGGGAPCRSSPTPWHGPHRTHHERQGSQLSSTGRGRYSSCVSNLTAPNTSAVPVDLEEALGVAITAAVRGAAVIVQAEAEHRQASAAAHLCTPSATTTHRSGIHPPLLTEWSDAMGPPATTPSWFATPQRSSSVISRSKAHSIPSLSVASNRSLGGGTGAGMRSSGHHPGTSSVSSDLDVLDVSSSPPSMTKRAASRTSDGRHTSTGSQRSGKPRPPLLSPPAGGSRRVSPNASTALGTSDAPPNHEVVVSSDTTSNNHVAHNSRSFPSSESAPGGSGQGGGNPLHVEDHPVLYRAREIVVRYLQAYTDRVLQHSASGGGISAFPPTGNASTSTAVVGQWGGGSTLASRQVVNSTQSLALPALTSSSSPFHNASSPRGGRSTSPGVASSVTSFGGAFSGRPHTPRSPTSPAHVKASVRLHTPPPPPPPPPPTVLPPLLSSAALNGTNFGKEELLSFQSTSLSLTMASPRRQGSGGGAEAPLSEEEVQQRLSRASESINSRGAAFTNGGSSGKSAVLLNAATGGGIVSPTRSSPPPYGAATLPGHLATPSVPVVVSTSPSPSPSQQHQSVLPHPPPISEMFRSSSVVSLPDAPFGSCPPPAPLCPLRMRVLRQDEAPPFIFRSSHSSSSSCSSSSSSFSDSGASTGEASLSSSYTSSLTSAISSLTEDPDASFGSSGTSPAGSVMGSAVLDRRPSPPGPHHRTHPTPRSRGTKVRRQPTRRHRHGHQDRRQGPLGGRADSVNNGVCSPSLLSPAGAFPRYGVTPPPPPGPMHSTDDTDGPLGAEASLSTSTATAPHSSPQDGSDLTSPALHAFATPSSIEYSWVVDINEMSALRGLPDCYIAVTLLKNSQPVASVLFFPFTREKFAWNPNAPPIPTPSALSPSATHPSSTAQAEMTGAPPAPPANPYHAHRSGSVMSSKTDRGPVASASYGCPSPSVSGAATPQQLPQGMNASTSSRDGSRGLYKLNIEPLSLGPSSLSLANTPSGAGLLPSSPASASPAGFGSTLFRQSGRVGSAGQGGNSIYAYATADSHESLFLPHSPGHSRANSPRSGAHTPPPPPPLLPPGGGSPSSQPLANSFVPPPFLLPHNSSIVGLERSPSLQLPPPSPSSPTPSAGYYSSGGPIHFIPWWTGGELFTSIEDRGAYLNGVRLLTGAEAGASTSTRHRTRSPNPTASSTPPPPDHAYHPMMRANLPSSILDVASSASGSSLERPSRSSHYKFHTNPHAGQTYPTAAHPVEVGDAGVLLHASAPQPSGMNPHPEWTAALPPPTTASALCGTMVLMHSQPPPSAGNPIAPASSSRVGSPLTAEASTTTSMTAAHTIGSLGDKSTSGVRLGVQANVVSGETNNVVPRTALRGTGTLLSPLRHERDGINAQEFFAKERERESDIAMELMLRHEIDQLQYGYHPIAALAYVAAGRADVVLSTGVRYIGWHRLMGAALLVREAGGYVRGLTITVRYKQRKGLSENTARHAACGNSPKPSQKTASRTRSSSSPVERAEHTTVESSSPPSSAVRPERRAAPTAIKNSRVKSAGGGSLSLPHPQRPQPSTNIVVRTAKKPGSPTGQAAAATTITTGRHDRTRTLSPLSSDDDEARVKKTAASRGLLLPASTLKEIQRRDTCKSVAGAAEEQPANPPTTTRCTENSLPRLVQTEDTGTSRSAAATPDPGLRNATAKGVAPDDTEGESARRRRPKGPRHHHHHHRRHRAAQRQPQLQRCSGVESETFAAPPHPPASRGPQLDPKSSSLSSARTHRTEGRSPQHAPSMGSLHLQVRRSTLGAGSRTPTPRQRRRHRYASPRSDASTGSPLQCVPPPQATSRYRSRRRRVERDGTGRGQRHRRARWKGGGGSQPAQSSVGKSTASRSRSTSTGSGSRHTRRRPPRSSDDIVAMIAALDRGVTEAMAALCMKKQLGVIEVDVSEA